MGPRFVVSTLLILLLSATLSAQTRCTRCKNHGWIPCPGKEHIQKRVCGTSLPHRCDILYRARCCRGIGRLPCPKCNDTIGRLQIEEEMETRRRWTKKMAKVDGSVGVRFVHIESKHFLLHWSVASWKERNKTRDRVKSGHLFAERLEKLAKRFEQITESIPKSRQVVYCSSNLIHHKKTTKYLMGAESSGTWTKPGSRGRIAIWPEPRFTRKAKDFHASLVFNVVGILCQASERYTPGFAPWFQNGLSHWIERDQFGISRNFNNTDPDKPEENTWIDGLWRRKIRKLAQRRRDPDVEKLLDDAAEELDPTDQVIAWSYVDFLMKGPDKAKFPAFFKALKKRNHVREALDEVYGMSAKSFHEAWRNYVMRSY